MLENSARRFQVLRSIRNYIKEIMPDTKENIPEYVIFKTYVKDYSNNKFDLESDKYNFMTEESYLTKYENTKMKKLHNFITDLAVYLETSEYNLTKMEELCQNLNLI